MGSVLKIVANHGLNFSTARQGIIEVEKCLGQSIETIQSRLMLEVTKTEETESTRYFCFSDYAEENFNRYKEIMLYTNNIFCPELQIKLQAISFYPLCRYSYWKHAILGEADNKVSEAQITRCNQIWPSIRSFAIEIVKLLKGNKLIYFEDDRFQNEVDIVIEGGLIEDMFKAMTLKWEPTNYTYLTNGIIDNKVRNGWYYELI